ncbi:MAG TPA: S41 family peptidase [Gemmataceae bacterium]|nr:S41 family peptidase [Gemmataceae bacterium]
MPRRNLAWLLGIAAVAVFGFAVSHSAPSREKDRDYEMVRLVVDVLHEVRHKYVTDVDPERERKLVEDMINGGLERLDPHSTYINPHEYKQFSKNSKGEFGGVGIQIGYDRQKGGVLSVISPMPGTPAYEAGVLAGDVIVKIDGKSTETMRLTEAVDMIQGEPGEKVTLTVLHEGSKEPTDIEIVRAKIQVQAVMGDRRKADTPTEWDYFIDKENKIGYIRLTGFSETAPKEMKDAVTQLQKQGLRGLVIDLRNNPGGLLRAAVEISNLFISEGKIVSTKGRNHKDEVYEAKPGNTILPAEKCPIAILVNRYSASASEILSACLQDHDRAVVVGERSYGKGSVQNVIEMKEGGDTAALKLTTASYWRPSGKNIHRFPDAKESDEWGVKPNEGFEVKLSDEERLSYMLDRTQRDVVRGKGNGAEPPKDEKDKKKPFEDRVLNKALEYLRGEIKRAEARPPGLPDVRHG